MGEQHTPQVQLLLGPRPLPRGLSQREINRIKHWRAIHDEALAALSELGDVVMVVLPEVSDDERH